jgi:PAS domain S-box-containing protein
MKTEKRINDMNKEPVLLIVDDDKDTLLVLKAITKRAGYNTYTVSTGEECFKFLEETTPNLILIDVQLHNEDGITICEEIKSNKHFNNTHVLLISGKSKTSKTITKGLNAGANGFITKPIDSQELVARLDVFRKIQKAEREIKNQSIEIQEQYEEIQALNEELLSQNEELRKTNLELESLSNEKTSAINELEQSEIELSDTKILLETIINSIPDIIGLQDKDHSIIRYNKAGYDFLGVSPQEVKGKKCYELINRITECEECASSKCYETKQPESIEKYTPELDTWHDVRAYPVLDDKGEIKYVVEHLRDITERKKQAKQIEKARHEWENIFNAIGQPAIILDKHHNLVQANNAVLEKTGKSFEELKKLKCWEIFHGNESKSPAKGCPAQMLMKTGNIKPIEMEMNAFDGIYMVSCTPITNGNNEVEGIIHIATDITHRVEAEKQLKEREETLRVLLENIPFAVYAHDMDGRFKIVNASSENQTGYTKNELLELTVADIDHESVSRNDREKIWHKNQHGNFTTIYSEHYRKDGSSFPVEINITAIHLNKELINLAIVQNISERLESQKSLQESEQRYRTLVSNFPDGIIIHNGKAIKYANKVVADTLGMKEEHVTELDLGDIFRKDSMQNALQRLNDFMKGEKVKYPLEDTYTLLNGRKIPVEVFASKVKYEGEDCIQVIVRDISSRKEMEQKEKELYENLEKEIQERTKELDIKRHHLEESQTALIFLLEDVNDSRNDLERLNNELTSINKELESFSYSISHDLRAPLTRMDGFTKIIEEEYSDNIDEQGKHYLKRIRHSCDHLGNLIDDVLTLSRITRRKLILSDIDLSAIVKSQVNELVDSDPVRKSDIKIQKDIHVNGDKTLLTVLLQNLTDNAWKFTRNKEKTIIEFGMTEEDKQKVYYFKDNGVGFNMKYYDKLFIPFQRLHQAKDFPGTGVGLATVQRIINRHGGKIWAESEEGKGSTFFFTLNK